MGVPHRPARLTPMTETAGVAPIVATLWHCFFLEGTLAGAPGAVGGGSFDQGRAVHPTIARERRLARRPGCNLNI